MSVRVDIDGLPARPGGGRDTLGLRDPCSSNEPGVAQALVVAFDPTSGGVFEAHTGFPSRPVPCSRAMNFEVGIADASTNVKSAFSTCVDTCVRHPEPRTLSFYLKGLRCVDQRMPALWDACVVPCDIRGNL